MRTTVRLDDALLTRARREAARRGVTLTALIDQGLRLARPCLILADVNVLIYAPGLGRGAAFGAQVLA